MPQTIYMPQDPSKIGNILAPAAGQAGNFMWNLLSQQVADTFAKRRQETQRGYETQQKTVAHERAKELIDYKKTQEEPEKPYKIGTIKKIGRGESEFEWGVNIGLKDWAAEQYPGMPPGWAGTGVTGQRTPAVKIDMGDRLKEFAEKKRITQEFKVTDPNFRNQVVSLLRNRYTPDDWDDKSSYERDELVFREMHERIKATHPDAVFDHKRNAWVQMKGGGLIRRYTGTSLDLETLTPRPRGQYR